MSKCPEYGWRGHWFKTLDPEKDNILLGKPDAKKCACGMYESEQSLKEQILYSYSERNSLLFSPTLWGISFIITTGIVFFIVVGPIFVSNADENCNPSTSGDFQDSNMTAVCLFSTSIRKWFFLIMGITFGFFIINKFLRGFNYD